MRRTLLALGAALPLALALAAPVSADSGVRVRVAEATGQKIAGQYLVTLRAGVSAADAASAVSARPLRAYTSALRGFAAKLSDHQVRALQRTPNVLRIEEDAVVRATTTQRYPAWGLDRIDERALPLSKRYNYNLTGSGVKAYIIDSGIQTSHTQFGGRARVAYDAIGDGRNGQDCNGHGTHVAGTVSSSRYGVAKRTTLYAVRVLDCNGSGSYSGVIAGLDWVTRNHGSPAVANLSLGGGYSPTLNSAVTRMVESGVFTAVAAGNSSADACDHSPASAAKVITVAASTSGDYRASFSNYGRCVEVYAPGRSVTSTWIGGGKKTISGTSMAAPHVTGVGALYRQKHRGGSVGGVNSWIVNAATTSKIRANPSGTPNRLLYKSTL